MISSQEEFDDFMRAKIKATISAVEDQGDIETLMHLMAHILHDDDVASDIKTVAAPLICMIGELMTELTALRKSNDALANLIADKVDS